MRVKFPEGVEESIPEFLDLVQERSGQDIRNCYQCAKCTAGCPTAFAMDSPPNVIMHMIQLGLADAALARRSIWLCAGCETCTTRCPRDIDIARVMKTLCEIAMERNVPVPASDIRTFHEAFLRGVQWHGRAHEISMMAELKLRTKNLFEDVPLGVNLFLKGKLRPLPERIEGLEQVRRMFRREPRSEAGQAPPEHGREHE
jgi:heterodisulfide reductase subunit C